MSKHVPRVDQYSDFLDAGADIHARDDNQSTCLHLASFPYQTNFLVKFLLERGAKVDAQDKIGWTPLHYAALNENEVLVKLLLSYGASVETINADGITALHIAAKRDASNICSMLLKKGASVNACIPRDPLKYEHKLGNSTPLHVAAYNGNLAATKVLHAHKADIRAETQGGMTALDLAQEERLYVAHVKGKRYEFGVEERLEQVITYLAKVEFSELQEAVVKGEVETLRELLEKSRYSPEVLRLVFLKAKECNKKEIVMMLLNDGYLPLKELSM